MKGTSELLAAVIQSPEALMHSASLLMTHIVAMQLQVHWLGMCSGVMACHAILRNPVNRMQCCYLRCDCMQYGCGCMQHVWPQLLCPYQVVQQQHKVEHG